MVPQRCGKNPGKNQQTRSCKIFSRRQFTGLSAAPIMAACSRLRESRGPRISPHLALQTELAQDPQRPRYHLVAPAGKMGDPNGPIFWNGNYHMFYIHDPAFAGIQSWGHAVSNYLVHWKHLPISTPLPISSIGNTSTRSWSGERMRSPRPVPVHSAPRAKPGRFGKCPICFLWPTSTC